MSTQTSAPARTALAAKDAPRRGLLAAAAATAAQTVLPLMAMHVVTAAAAWLLLPTALPRRSK